MDRIEAAIGRIRLPGWLLALGIFGSCFGLLALPVLAEAEGEEEEAPAPLVCPAGGVEPGELVEPSIEIHLLRDDVAVTCAVLAERAEVGTAATQALRSSVLSELLPAVESLQPVVPAVEEVAGNTAALEAQLGNLLAAVEQLHDDLRPEGAVFPVRIAGQDSPVEVEVPGGVLVNNPTNVEGVQAAVHEATETGNQNAWAIAGLAFGVILLIFVWKVVRP